MKKVYIVIAMIFIAGMTFGQTFNVKSVTSKKLVIANHESSKSATDTTGIGVGAQTTFIPQFAPGGQAYSYSNQGGGYVFGVNNISGSSIAGLAQGYSCLTTGHTVGIDGVTMLFCGKKSVSSDPTSKLTFSIWNKPDSIPTTQVGTTTADLLFSNCDTVFGTLCTASFPTVIVVNADFSIYCSFANIKTDTVGFCCDADGEGVGWAALKYGTTWYTYKAGYNLNTDIALFAIVDMNYVGINDNYFFQGAKMTIKENPTQGNLSLDYMVENDSKVKFELLNLNGKSVLTVDEGFKQKGIVNSINADISNLASGTYLCSLESNGQRLIKKLVVK